LLGDAKSSLGDAESSLGDAESSLGDAESSLGGAGSSLGDVQVLRSCREGAAARLEAHYAQLSAPQRHGDESETQLSRKAGEVGGDAQTKLGCSRCRYSKGGCVGCGGGGSDETVKRCVGEISAVDAALAQCIFCLYGVDLKVQGLEAHDAAGKATLARFAYTLSRPWPTRRAGRHGEQQAT
jgi:hypothetical protein